MEDFYFRENIFGICVAIELGLGGRQHEAMKLSSGKKSKWIKQ